MMKSRFNKWIAASLLALAAIGSAHAAGAGIVDKVFRHSGAGAVSRTFLDKARDSVSVKDFGAKPNDGIDDTAAIQAAINAVGTAGGGIVDFLNGKYEISSQINIAQSNVVLRGDSRFATLIQQNTLNAKIIYATGAGFGLSRMSFIYNGTPAPGATAITSAGNYSYLNDFVVRSASIALHMNSGVGQKVTNFELLDFEVVGLLVESLNDVFASNFIINAGNMTRGTLGGIRLVNKVEAFIASDGDVLLGVYSMTTDGVYSAGSRPAYNNFTNVFFDSAAKGVSLEKIVATSFVGCWFSGGRTDTGYPGVVIGQTDGLVFHASRFINNGSHGALLTNRAKRTTFTGNTFDSNSVTAGAAVAHGLAIEGGATDFVVQANIAHNGLLAGQQGYPILLNAGASDRYIIADNLVSGNASGGVIDGGSGVNKRVANNY